MNMSNLAVIQSIYKNDKLVFVRQAIESILKQSYSDFDYYIIADGELSDEVENYLSDIEDNRIIIRKNEQNVGLAKSLNNLLNIVLLKGYGYIARMDADDISQPERFEKQVAFLEQNKDIDIVGTWATEIDENGEVYYKKRMPLTHDDCYEFFQKRDPLVHPSVMFRRTYFEKAGVYPIDTFFEEDTMLWANGFANGCRFANIPEYLFNFRLDRNFFKRRRGWKHAWEIFMLRLKINRILHYSINADIYALLYAIAKMMPSPILNIIYKTMR